MRGARMDSSEMSKIVISISMAIISLFLHGCNDKYGKKGIYIEKVISGHTISIIGAEQIDNTYYDEKGTIYLHSNGTTVSIVSNNLFVNNKAYGKINENSHIMINKKEVLVDNITVIGRPLSLEEKILLNPKRTTKILFKNYVFEINWESGLVVGKVKTLLGKEYLAVGNDKYDVAGSTLIKNNKSIMSLTTGNVICIDGQVVLLK